MGNIFLEAKDACCKQPEIFLPCSEEEIESIINFLYCGSISLISKSNIFKILDCLTRIFGFPNNLFSIEDQFMLNNQR